MYIYFTFIFIFKTFINKCYIKQVQFVLKYYCSSIVSSFLCFLYCCEVQFDHIVLQTPH